MTDKSTLVMKYHAMVSSGNLPSRWTRSSFSFYARIEKEREWNLGESFPLGVYIQGPIGEKKRFVIIKDGFNEEPGRVVEVANTEEEARIFAYEEAIKLKDVLLRNYDFLSPGKFIDETGFANQSKLEQSVQA